MRPASARLIIGNHPRVQALKALEIEERPLFSGFFPETHGVLDDHFECWFVSEERPPATEMEGMRSVVDLGQSRQWLAPPKR